MLNIGATVLKVVLEESTDDVDYRYAFIFTKHPHLVVVIKR